MRNPGRSCNGRSAQAGRTSAGGTESDTSHATWKARCLPGKEPLNESFENTGFKDETGVRFLCDRVADSFRDSSHVLLGLRIFRPEFELAAIVARDDMKMQMEHDLSCCCLVI